MQQRFYTTLSPRFLHWKPWNRRTETGQLAAMVRRAQLRTLWTKPTKLEILLAVVAMSRRNQTILHYCLPSRSPHHLFSGSLLLDRACDVWGLFSLVQISLILQKLWLLVTIVVIFIRLPCGSTKAMMILVLLYNFRLLHLSVLYFTRPLFSNTPTVLEFGLLVSF